MIGVRHCQLIFLQMFSHRTGSTQVVCIYTRARARARAETRLFCRYEREVSSQLKEHVGVLEQEREEDLLRTGLLSR